MTVRANITRYIRLFMTIALLCSAAVACSSSGSGTGDATSGSTSSQVAGSASSIMSEAQAAVASLEKPATKIAVTTPLKSKPTAGKLIVFMNCDIQCSLVGNGIHAAATAVGWRYKSIPFHSTDTSGLVSGLQQALQYHPAAVAVAGIPEPAWSSVLPAYKAAGVPIVLDAVSPATIDSTVIADISGADEQTALGSHLAQWFIADSKAKGHALVVTSNDIGIFKLNAEAFASTVTSKCPDCKVTTDNLPLTVVNSGGGPAAILSKLQNDPGISYVISVDGPVITGMAKQLSSQGYRGKIKIAGLEGDSGNLTNLKAGSEHAWLNASITQAGWSVMDAALRHAQGMALDPHQNEMPEQLLTRSSSFTIGDSYDEPNDYPDQYKRLWLVG